VATVYARDVFESIKRSIYPIEIAAQGMPMTHYSNAGVDALAQAARSARPTPARDASKPCNRARANERPREYLRSGVGRRLRVLHRTLSNMFELSGGGGSQSISCRTTRGRQTTAVDMFTKAMASLSSRAQRMV
jgi:hypothetical protein